MSFFRRDKAACERKITSESVFIKPQIVDEKRYYIFVGVVGRETVLFTERTSFLCNSSY